MRKKNTTKLPYSITTSTLTKINFLLNTVNKPQTECLSSILTRTEEKRNNNRNNRYDP